jgi:branched-chain amino acid transport system permease protein
MKRAHLNTRFYLALLVCAGAIAAFPSAVPNPYYLNVANIIGLNTIVVVGLNLLIGYAGQISLGHAAFYGLGAYLSAILTVTYHLPPWLALPVALLVTGAVALLIGIPTLRLHGHYLVMATLGFNLIVNIVIIQWDSVTGGPSGFPGIPSLTLGPWEFDSDRKMFYLIWACVLLGIILALNLVNSRVGRGLRALHASEVAASASGVKTEAYKVKVFVLSALYASVAGSLYAHYLTFVSPKTFDIFFSVELVTMVIVGGMGSVWGALFGTSLLTSLPNVLHVFDEYKDVFYGLILVGILIFLPQGVVVGLRQLWLSRGSVTVDGEKTVESELPSSTPGSLTSQPSVKSAQMSGAVSDNVPKLPPSSVEGMDPKGPPWNGKAEEATKTMEAGSFSAQAECVRVPGTSPNPLPCRLPPGPCRAEPTEGSPILSARNVTISFGGILALAKVSFAMVRGGVTALIGPNGAGKTTMINVISGMYSPHKGSVLLEGIDVTGRAAHSMAARGLTRTFQNVQIFDNMSVLENVMVGLHALTTRGFVHSLTHPPGFRKGEQAIEERAWEALEFFGLERRANLSAGDLSFGEQKRIEMARALVSEPAVVLLDEPVAGLNMTETNEIAALIGKVRSRGISVLLVEHDMNLVMAISDKVVVLNYGRKIAEGNPEQIQKDDEVRAAYLGG